MKQRLLTLLFIALMMPIGAWAALSVGDRFTVDGMNFQVTSVNPNEVQVGYNAQPAIDKNTQGAVNIPSSVNDSEGNSYSVTSIALMAFGGCTNLKSISIPSSITSISSSGFSGCNSITEVHITDVAAYCQIDFGGGESNPLSFEGAYLYVNGVKTTDLVIPEGVTSICKHAFWKCNSLTSVTIPKGVSISMYAFYECQGLTSITCASSIDGERAFCNCPNLTRVILLDGVETVGPFAFRDCKALANVSISASVKKLDYSAFGKCTGLTTVNIEDIAAWCAMEIGFSDSSPLYYAHHLFMNGKEVKDLVIPEGVSAINSEVFNGCEALSSVTIPTTVTSIGYEAFRGCTSLSSVNIPSKMTEIGACAFQNCTSISSINIPSSITSIGSSAFKGCTSLTEVHITDIAAWCGIDFSSSGNPLSVAKHLFLNGNEVKNLVIPEGVTAIKQYVFYGWENLTSVSIPKSITSIGSSAFKGCTSLTEVHITDIAAWCAIPFIKNDSGDNPLKIARHLYMDGVEVKDLVIPEGVTSISYGAFNGCKFNSVSIPSSLTSISDFAFNGVGANTVYIKDLAAWCKIQFGSSCNPLFNVQHLFVNGEEITDLVIPDGVTEISDYAFMDCNALSSVNTGNTVRSIGFYSFAGCDNINTITIGKSVTSIDVAFFCCKELKSVKSMIEDPFEIDKNTFTYRETADDPIKEPNATLYVPVGTKAKYEAIEGWKKFKNIEEISNKHTLTYVVDGVEYKAYEIETGTTITPEAEPTKEGYTFSGWSEIPETMPAEDVTVTGSFTVNKYNLIYMVDGEEYKSYEVEYGATITPEAEPTKEGYTFSGWSEIPETMPAKDVTITGIFTQNATDIDIEPMDENAVVNANDLDGQDLTDNVVGNIYFNVGDNGYDASDGSVVISQSTNMGQITNAVPGSEDVKNNFNGMILKVSAGKGTITVNVKTTGNAQLVVQVGNNTPMIASKTEKGDVVFSYDVTDDTYVYIYAIIGSSNARMTRASSDDVVKIYGITVSPGATGIMEVKHEATAKSRYYTLDGRQIVGKPTTKGIYVIEGRKVMVK